LKISLFAFDKHDNFFCRPKSFDRKKTGDCVFAFSLVEMSEETASVEALWLR